MPNVLTLTVEDPNDIRNAGAYDTGALIRLQTATTEAGSYADVTGTGSTPTINVVADTRSYTGFDPAGTSSSWYRTRFENAGGTRLSDWSAAFQAGDETAGLICSLYDVQQELGGTFSASDNERILDIIRQVTSAIEGYCSRWFVPRPTGGGTKDLLLSPGYDNIVRVMRDGRTIIFPYGVRSITTFGYALIDQPSSGGTYSTFTSAQYVIPQTLAPGWPATRVVLLQTTGALLMNGLNTVQWQGGTFGFSAVPADIQGVGIRAAVRRFIGKGGGAVTAIGPNGTEILLPDLSGADRRTLDFYAFPAVG